MAERQRGGGSGPIRPSCQRGSGDTVAAPAYRIQLLIPAFLGVLGGLTIPFLDIKLDPLKTPYDVVPLLVVIWMVIGIVLYVVLRSRTPNPLDRIGDVMTDADV